MSGVSMAIGRAQSPPDGGVIRKVDGFLVVVVSSSTVGTGESCSGIRPITMMICVID